MESSLTPNFCKAAAFYCVTYGKIPSIFSDLKVHKNSELHIKVYSINSSILRLVWSAAMLFSGFIARLPLRLLLIKKLYLPQTTQLDLTETVFCILYISSMVILYCCLLTFKRNSSLVNLFNDFITNGLHLGKYKYIHTSI